MMFALFDRTVAWKLALVVSAVLVAFHGLLIHFFLYPDPKDIQYRHESLVHSRSPPVRHVVCMPQICQLRAVLLDPFYLTVSLHMETAKLTLSRCCMTLGKLLVVSSADCVRQDGGTVPGCRNYATLLLHHTILRMGFVRYDSAAIAGFRLHARRSSQPHHTAISADLGTHESIRGDAEALSTVTGIIDGTGSVGAALLLYHELLLIRSRRRYCVREN
ncbi:Glucose-6-phosphate exchanger SLC37A1 [Phytophthora ramorum]|uniref:Glucose-6-phosphate exchanger SLC37A1 n=1 Tax=Phytophthora ramorum TaxID=164328 RepID=UPI0030A647C1|nr:Glucose-6-phosphate exchanger SLC37A1 [Phytophthora ramorum]